MMTKKKEKPVYTWVVTTFLMKEVRVRAHSCIIYIDEGMLVFKRDNRIVYAFQKGSWLTFKEVEYLE